MTQNLNFRDFLIFPSNERSKDPELAKGNITILNKDPDQRVSELYVYFNFKKCHFNIIRPDTGNKKDNDSTFQDILLDFLGIHDRNDTYLIKQSLGYDLNDHERQSLFQKTTLSLSMSSTAMSLEERTELITVLEFSILYSHYDVPIRKGTEEADKEETLICLRTIEDSTKNISPPSDWSR